MSWGGRGRRGGGGRRGRGHGGLRHRRVGGRFRYGGARFGPRRYGPFGFGRRQRRALKRRRNRTGTGGMDMLLCCFGLNSDPNIVIQKDVAALGTWQQQFLLAFLVYNQDLQQQPARQQLPQEQPAQQQLDPYSIQELRTWSSAQSKEIQDEQKALLDDILKLQIEERDPGKLEELQQQQNLLILQMQTLQASGFQYESGMPQDQSQCQLLPQPQAIHTGLQPVHAGQQTVYTGPQPAINADQQPVYTGQQPTYTRPQPMYTGQPALCPKE